MKILALDISPSATGWTVDGESGVPRFGTYRLRPTDLGCAGVAFGDWLSGFIALTKPEMVAVEAPVIGGVPTSLHEAMMQVGLAFLALTIAKANDIRGTTAHVQSVRKHVLGQGRPAGGKKAVAAFLQDTLRWSVKNTDEADSAALWIYAKAHHDRSFRLITTPMFAGAAA